MCGGLKTSATDRTKTGNIQYLNFKHFYLKIMKKNKTKLFLFTTVIILNVLFICVADMHGEDVNRDQGHSKDEESVRGPFTLPPEVNFLRKAQKTSDAYSGSGEWKEGMVASSVKGIFRSDGKSIANINHVWVETGNWVGEEQVTEIDRDRVVLSGKSGEERTLFMQQDGAGLKITRRIISKKKENK